MKTNEKRVALITGAGSGLGRAIAKALAKEGFRVALTGRRAEKLKEVADEIGKEDTITISADVSNPEAVKKLHRELMSKTDGKLDLLVNNAGGVPAMGTISDIPFEQWDLVMNTNLTTQFLVTQAFLPELRKSENAKILSIISGMAHFFMNGFGPYSASKAGVEALMKTVAEEEKENNIAVHLFDPGNVISEGNPQGEKHPDEIMDDVLKLVR